MKIKESNLYSFDVPLTQALRLKKNYIKNRQGYIIELIADNNSKGYGEIAPLPFFHKETLEEAKKELFYFHKHAKGKKINEMLEIEQPFLPSVAWGIETAIWNLYATHKQTFPAHIWNKNAGSSVVLNGLASGSIEEVKQQVQALITENVKTIKLKVGKNSIEEDLANIAYIRNTFGQEIKIRLDANRAWSLPTAIKFVKKAFQHNIEYLEEPVKKEHLESIISASSIPIALDETIYENIEYKNIIPGIEAIILKPSLLGGIAKTRSWITWAQKQKIKCTISSSFDTSIGLHMLANLATTTSTPAGLMTYKWLKQDTILEKFYAKNGNASLNHKFQLSDHCIKIN